MTTPVGILFQNPFGRVLSAVGQIQPSMTATFYLTGTTTPANVYSDGACTVSIGNVVTADATGTLPAFYLSPLITYKVVLATSVGAQIGSPVDPYVVPAATTAISVWYGGLDTGAANAYVLTFASNFSAYSNGLRVAFVPANNNSGASTVNINSIGIVNLQTVAGTTLGPGALVAGQPVDMIYYGGSFLLLGPSGAYDLLATGNVALGGAGKTLQGWGATFAAYEDMSPDHSSWTTTLSGGFAANPTGTLKWRKIGSFASIYSDAQLTGTSNAATDITASGVPAEITPAQNRRVFCFGLVNNGNVNYSGQCIISSAGTLSITLANAAGAGSTIQTVTGLWATANAKGLDSGFMVTYPL
jgi:hypothetical protein